MAEKNKPTRFTLRFEKYGKEKDIYNKLELYSKKEKKSKQQFIMELLDKYFNNNIFLKIIENNNNIKDILDKYVDLSKNKNNISISLMIYNALSYYLNNHKTIDNLEYKNDKSLKNEFDNRNKFINEVLDMIVDKTKKQSIKTNSNKPWDQTKIRKKYSYLKKNNRLPNKKLEEFDSIDELKDMIIKCINNDKLNITNKDIKSIFSKYKNLINI